LRLKPQEAPFLGDDLDDQALQYAPVSAIEMDANAGVLVVEAVVIVCNCEQSFGDSGDYSGLGRGYG